MTQMTLKKFYGTLIVFYFSDMALLLSVIWLSYQITKNPLILGMMLFISNIIPFLIKKMSKINLLSLSFAHLMLLRIILYLCIFILAIFTPNIYTFIGISCICGILGISVLSNYESYNNCLVVQNIVSANNASRYMQTVIQIGAFAGAMIGGFLLNHLSFFWTIFSIVMVDVVFAFVCLFLMNFKTLDNPKDNPSNDSSLHDGVLHIDKRQFYFLCIILGMIGVHITSFNLTTPIIFQEIKHWNAQDFGLSSAFAGAGAFLAVFLKNNLNRCFIFATILIVLDLLFIFLPIKLLSFVACFFIGIAINSIRILVREKLSLLAKNKAQASWIGQNSAVYYVVFQSLASLIIGYILANTNNINISQSFLPLTAVIICICILYYGFVLLKQTSMVHSNE